MAKKKVIEEHAGKIVSTRGRLFIGTIVNTPLHGSATVEWESRALLPKYERYEKRKSRICVHNNLNAKYGDRVEIKECRPISKTKKFVVIKILGRDLRFIERADAREAGKFKRAEEPTSEEVEMRKSP